LLEIWKCFALTTILKLSKRFDNRIFLKQDCLQKLRQWTA